MMRKQSTEGFLLIHSFLCAGLHVCGCNLCVYVCSADCHHFQTSVLSASAVWILFVYCTSFTPPVKAHLINLSCVFAMIINGSKWGCWKNLERLRALKVKALIALQCFWANKVFFFFSSDRRPCGLWGNGILWACVLMQNKFLIPSWARF